jgi:hypothetical protein
LKKGADEPLDGPLDGPLEKIRAGLEKEQGKPVTAGQVLTKWLQEKGVIVITYVKPSFPERED